MDQKYEGMTINERLHIRGLLKEFDKAVENKQVGNVVEILKQVDLSEPSIDPILKSLGLVRS